jgi:hypothetical protein
VMYGMGLLSTRVCERTIVLSGYCYLREPTFSMQGDEVNSP